MANIQLRTKVTLLVIICAIMFVCGCVSTKAVLLNPGAEKYSSVLPEDVIIFTSESELDTLDYVRIAIIEATGSGEWTSQAGMYKAIRKKAAELGANGVLMPEINEPGAGAKVAGAIFGTGTERKGNAIAIRILGYKEKSP